MLKNSLHKYHYPVVALLLYLVSAASGCTTLNSALDENKSAHTDLFNMSVEAQRAYRESRWTDSVRLYQALVEKLPSDAFAWFYLANTYARQGAFDSATHAYETSLRLNNEQPKAWFNLSRVHLLNAQSALRQSTALMTTSDPGRLTIADNLIVLDDLIHGRSEP